MTPGDEAARAAPARWSYSTVNARYLNSPRRCTCTTTGSPVRSPSTIVRSSPSPLTGTRLIADHVPRSESAVARIAGAGNRRRDDHAGRDPDWQHLTDFAGHGHPEDAEAGHHVLAHVHRVGQARKVVPLRHGDWKLLCSPVGLEFVVRRRREAGRGPCNGRPSAHDSGRHGLPCVHRRRPAAYGLPMTRASVPRCSRPGTQ